MDVEIMMFAIDVVDATLSAFIGVMAIGVIFVLMVVFAYFADVLFDERKTQDYVNEFCDADYEPEDYEVE